PIVITTIVSSFNTFCKLPWTQNRRSHPYKTVTPGGLRLTVVVGGPARAHRQRRPALPGLPLVWAAVLVWSGPVLVWSGLCPGVWSGLCPGLDFRSTSEAERSQVVDLGYCHDPGGPWRCPVSC